MNLNVKLTSALQYHQSVIDNARQSAKDMPGGRPLAIALDTVSFSHLTHPSYIHHHTADIKHRKDQR